MTIDPESGIERTMGLWGGTSLIVGCIVGTGIFSNGGSVLTLVGSPGMAMFMWLFGGVLAYFGGFSYTEWSLMIPESGGDTPYLEYAYKSPRQFFSFLYCFGRVLLVHTGYSAALSTVVGIYLTYAFPLSDSLKPYAEWVTKGIAVVAMTLVFLLCAFSNKVATKTTSIITILKIGMVLFVAVSGAAFALGAFPSVKRPVNPGGVFAGTSTNPSDYASAIFKVAFAYDGWSMLSTSVGELKDPLRNIPRAIIGGVTIVTTLYIAANLSYFAALSAIEIKSTEAVLAAEFASRLYGDFFGRKVMALLILVSAFGSCLGITFGASRVVMEAGRRGFMPFSHHLAQVHPRFGTPFAALLFHYLISLVLIVVPPGQDTFFFLVDATGWPVWVLYTITLVGLLVVRFREPAKDRLFKVWIVCPLVVIATGIFLSVLPFFKGGSTTYAALVGAGLMISALPAYYWIVYRRLPKREPAIPASEEYAKKALSS
ncbi:amino acid/polyamine transporter I [Blastocladiella britannica]|nr:amino acid/polyamine transporter I [Blastocladiella britannica]